MEKIARGFWPQIQGNATEVWVYPLGWNMFFAGPTADRHHAVPAAQLDSREDPMIRSRLVVTKQTPLAPHGMVAAEHPRGAEVGAAHPRPGRQRRRRRRRHRVRHDRRRAVHVHRRRLRHHARPPGQARARPSRLNFNGVAPLAAHESMLQVVGGVSDGLFAWPRTEDAANEYGHRVGGRARLAGRPGAGARALRHDGAGATCWRRPSRWPATGSRPTGTWR